MRIEDLSVGNWVCYRGTNIKITSLYNKGESNEIGWSDKESVWVNGINVEPIPLQKLHLAKNGFVADEYDEVFTYKDGFEVSVIFDEGFPDEEVEPFIILKIEFAEKDMTMEIRYVHELQQALRLFGIEKEIKL